MSVCRSLNAKQNLLLIKDTKTRQSAPCLGESPYSSKALLER